MREYFDHRINKPIKAAQFIFNSSNWPVGVHHNLDTGIISINGDRVFSGDFIIYHENGATEVVSEIDFLYHFDQVARGAAPECLQVFYLKEENGEKSVEVKATGIAEDDAKKLQKYLKRLIK